MTPEAFAFVNQPVDVLDKGSVTLLDVMGDDASVEEAARVSFTGGEFNENRTLEQRRGLLRYLMRHAHTTPFEMVEFKFRIVCPIFVWRQWIRHRTANVNEISGRYAELPDLYYLPEKTRIAKQSASNKQGSGAMFEDAEADHAWHDFMVEQTVARSRYMARLDNDMAKELARINLPVSQYTAAVWKCDLHNLFHFLKLRLDPHAQHEIRVYAEAMARMVKAAVPLSWEAFEDFRLHSMSLTKQDISALAAVGTPAMEAEGYAHMIERAVAELNAAEKEGRKPDFTIAAPASYWPTTREATEFAAKIRRLFCGPDSRPYVTREGT